LRLSNLAVRGLENPQEPFNHPIRICLDDHFFTSPLLAQALLHSFNAKNHLNFPKF